MSLTKKDKEEVARIVAETLDKIKAGGEFVKECNTNYEIEQQIKNWNENAIDTGMGFKVALADLKIDGNEYFTWDKAKEIEEKYLKPNGWRLPTVGEFVMLYGKYGIDEDGEDDVEAFCEALKMEKKGYKYRNGNLRYQGSDGSWWSTTVYDDSYAYHLYMNSRLLNPQSNSNKAVGFALRCVSINDFSKQSREENRR